MHGKMFKREYIQEKNIRFNETRLHEDHAFNCIARLSGGKLLYESFITYLWKHNEASLTRSLTFDKNSDTPMENFSTNMTSFALNAEYTISELIKRKIKKEDILYAIKGYILTFYKYYIIMLHDGISENYVAKFYGEIKNFYDNLPDDFKADLTNEILFENFYENASIKELINNNIMFYVNFGDYVMSLKSDMTIKNNINRKKRTVRRI
jgi:hypothetical protein